MKDNSIYIRIKSRKKEDFNLLCFHSGIRMTEKITEMIDNYIGKNKDRLERIKTLIKEDNEK